MASRVLISGGFDTHLIKWDARKGSILKKSSPAAQGGQAINPPFVYSLLLAKDGSTLMAGLGDYDVGLFNPVSLARVGTVAGHTGAVVALKHCNYADGQFVSASLDGHVRISTLKGELVLDLPHGAKINDVAAIPTSKLFVCDTTPIVTVYEL